MSGIVSGLVLRQPVTAKFTSEVKFVAVIYADHAWPDGTHAYPAIGTVAKESGYHERSVQRYVRILEGMGMLIPDGKGPRGTVSYRFPLVDGPNNAAFLDPQPIDGGVAHGHPRPTATPGGDNDSGDNDSGDTGVTRIKEQSFKQDHEEEEGAKTKKTEIVLSPQLEQALTNASVYKSVWPDIRKRLAAGWIEADIFAILVWMRAERKNGGHVATRIREGSKAPESYYPRVEWDDDQDIAAPDVADDPPDAEWIRGLLSVLKPECRRAHYAILEAAQYSREATPDGYLVRIGLRDGSPEVFQESFARVVERILGGAFDAPAVVQFVSAETEPA